ncbi:MAG: hypothetical protein ACLRWQ_10460 [Flavonifractor plautii]
MQKEARYDDPANRKRQRGAVHHTADLKEHGLTPAGLTLERALDALHRPPSTRRASLWSGPIEIEAYPDACGVLVFARVRRAGAGLVLLL